MKQPVKSKQIDAEEIARLRFVAQEAAHGVLAEFLGRPAVREYLRIDEIAKRLGWTLQAFRGRVSEGYFGIKEGVRRVGTRHVLIHWPTFQATVLSGNWKPSSASNRAGRERWKKYRRAHGSNE